MCWLFHCCFNILISLTSQSCFRLQQQTQFRTDRRSLLCWVDVCCSNASSYQEDKRYEDHSTIKIFPLNPRPKAWKLLPLCLYVIVIFVEFLQLETLRQMDPQTAMSLGMGLIYVTIVSFGGAARQMGFKERKNCPRLGKLAAEYIKKCEGCEDDIYSFFANEPDVDSLYVKLVEEFERCILSYFAFHWRYADILITQVLENP